MSQVERVDVLANEQTLENRFLASQYTAQTSVNADVLVSNSNGMATGITTSKVAHRSSGSAREDGQQQQKASHRSSRVLTPADQMVVKRASFVLANPVAIDSILTHSELTRLQKFGSKYFGRHRMESARSRRSFVSAAQYSIFTNQDLDDSTEHSQTPLWLQRLQAKLRRVVKSNKFRALLYFIVIADMAVLAMDSDDTAHGSALASLDIAFTLLLFLEIALKSIAFGFYSGPESYLKRSKYRILNILMLSMSLLSYLGGSKWKVLRGIKTFRSLALYAGLRRILKALVRAIPFLANVGTLALFGLLAFSIFGLEAYNGTYDNQCAITVDDTTTSSSSGSAVIDTLLYEVLPRMYCSQNATCEANGQFCAAVGPPSAHINFDSGISSLFLVFLVVAQDGWVTDIMQPVVEGTSFWSVLFFIAIIASMVFLVVNLFVAVITTAFMNFTVDEKGEVHQPNCMGKMAPEDEETQVNLIMGATLAIEESILPSSEALEAINEVAGGETELTNCKDGALVEAKPSIARVSLPLNTPMNGKAKEIVKILAFKQQWGSVQNLMVEAARELIQHGQASTSSVNDIMVPFARAYKRLSSQDPNHSIILKEEEGEQDTVSNNSPGKQHMMLPDFHNRAPFVSLNALITKTDNSGQNGFGSAFARFQKFVFSKRFDDFITGCILINTIFLLIEYRGMSSTLSTMLSVAEYLFGAIFACEMVMRIIAMKGIRVYLRSTERVFDMVVVICTSINMVLNNVDSNFSGLNSVSSLRTLRVSRLMMKWEGTRKLIESVMKSSRGVVDVLVFMLLFQVVNSIIAMQLFGGNHLKSEDNEQPRWNFDTFGRSFLTLLQVITGDQWSSITYDAVDAANPHWFMVPYLIIVFIIGQYVLLNLFIAVILENFSISEEEAYQLQLAQIIAIPKELDIYEKIEEVGVRAFGEMDQLENVNDMKLRVMLGLDDNQPLSSKGNSQYTYTSHRILGLSGTSNSRYAPHSHKSPQRLKRQTWYEFLALLWKKGCRRVAYNVWFSRMVQFMIFISCICMILDDPHPELSTEPPNAQLTMALKIINRIVLFVLVAELIVKVGATSFGLEYLRVIIFHKEDRLGYVMKQAYMEDPWNQLDLALLILALTDEIITDAFPAISASRVLRAFRVLRPLRILNHNQEMKVILNAVVQSLPHVGNVLALCILVYIIFGVVGRSLFSGKFYSCNDSTVTSASECVGFFSVFPDGALALQEAKAKEVPGGAVLVPRVWSNARFSFDNIGSGFLALLEMTSLKWIDKTFAAMDIVGDNKQPVQDYSPEFAIFFVLYVYVGSLFVIRLFVGVLVEQFQRNNGTEILTENQKTWVDLEKFILLLKPLKRIPRPKIHLQALVFDLCHHPYFSTGISMAILLNIALLLVNPNSTSSNSLSFKVIEIIFLVIFTIEGLLKCIGMRHYYIFSSNGAFELIILLGSISAHFFASGANYRAIIQAGRVFRVMRVLRFVSLNRGVRTIFQTFRASIRPIGQIFFLMFMIYFIFATIARQLFGGVKYGSSLNHFSNFRTFWSSTMLLFQIMSGDDWHLTMTDCMRAKPFCSERVFEPTGEIVTDCGSTTGAVLFFVTYVTLVVFIFLNLFIAVILENFRSCYLKTDVCAISLLDFELYRELFQNYDVHDQGTFPLWQLPNFLAELPSSLRIERSKQRSAFLQIRSQAQALSERSEAMQRKRPYFNELLRILCIHQMGIRSLPYEQQRDRVKQIFIYRAKVAQMLVESLVKGYIQRRKLRRERDINNRSKSQIMEPISTGELLEKEQYASRSIEPNLNVSNAEQEFSSSCMSPATDTIKITEKAMATHGMANPMAAALTQQNEDTGNDHDVSDSNEPVQEGMRHHEDVQSTRDHHHKHKHKHHHHHHHHRKKKHRKKHTQVIHSDETPLDTESDQSGIEEKEYVSDDATGMEQQLHVANDHTKDDILVRKLERERQLDPLHQPWRHLPKLRTNHSSSKVVPT